MIFIFPTKEEAQPFRTACPDATVEICGVGGAECAASVSKIISDMRSRGEEQTLILAGIAGSYNLNDVALCEVVEVSTESVESLPERYTQEYRVVPKTTLRQVRGNSVNNSTECQNFTPKAQVESMEGATFIALCNNMSVNCTQIRAISNAVGSPFAEWAINPALELLVNKLIGIFKQPSN